MSCIYIGIDLGRLNITAFPLSTPNENNIILWFVCRFSFSHFEHQQICYMARILVISNEYYIVSFHTTLVPWEEFVCTSARLSVEHYALQWLCVSRYSAGILCILFCFFLSSYINIGTVRLLGMHLWLFFWIVLFCWIIVCTLYFSVLFFVSAENRVVSTL